MLALTGQFESALEFLARSERFKVHGVHIAIALHELHLLALSASPGSLLRMVCINFFSKKRINYRVFQFLLTQMSQSLPVCSI